jgi:hypothetical protein
LLAIDHMQRRRDLRPFPLLAALTLSVVAPPAASQERIRVPDRPPRASATLELDTLWVIGAADGPPGTVFGWVASFDVDPDGRILVLDGQYRMLHAFDSAGRHLASVGREGAGPGEFQLPLLVSAASDGSIYVYDAKLGRVSEFDRELRFKGIITPSITVHARSMLVLGDIIFFAGMFPSGVAPRGVIHRFDRRTGEYLGSFGQLPPVQSELIRRQIGAGRTFPARDGGIWYTQVAPYHVQKFSPGGDLLIDLTRENGFLPSAEPAYTLHVDGPRATVTSRPHPTALALEEMDDGSIRHQVNLMDGRFVVDFFGPDLVLRASIVGPVPALHTPVGRERYVVAYLAPESIPSVALIQIRRW